FVFRTRLRQAIRRAGEEERGDVPLQAWTAGTLETVAVLAYVFVKSRKRVDRRRDHHVITVETRELGGIGTVGREPDGRMGLLQRLRRDRNLCNLEEAPLVGETFVGPSFADDRQAFLETLAAFVARDVVAAKMHGDRAAAHAQIKPPARQDIGNGGFFGDPQRMMKR